MKKANLLLTVVLMAISILLGILIGTYYNQSNEKTIKGTITIPEQTDFTNSNLAISVFEYNVEEVDSNDRITNKIISISNLVQSVEINSIAHSRLDEEKIIPFLLVINNIDNEKGYYVSIDLYQQGINDYKSYFGKGRCSHEELCGVLTYGKPNEINATIYMPGLTD